MGCRGGEWQLPNQESSLGVWPAGLLPDDGQRDEVHQEGHNGHVRGPVGVIGPQGPALHLAIGELPLPEYDEGGDGEQEGEAPGSSNEHLGLLFCSEKTETGLGLTNFTVRKYMALHI